MKSLALALLLSSTQAIELKSVELNAGKPWESPDIGIDAESFAQASVQARIDADLELDDLQSQKGIEEAAKHKTDIWNKHFKGSEFFKKYNAHVAERNEKIQSIQLNQKELSKVTKKYDALEKSYNELFQKTENIDHQQQLLAQQIPGGQQMLAQQMEGVNSKMKLMQVPSNKPQQHNKIEGVSFIRQSPVDKMNLMLDQQSLWENYNEFEQDDELKLQTIEDTPIEEEDIDGMSFSSNRIYEAKNIDNQMQEAVDSASEPVVIQHAQQQLPQMNQGASEWTVDDYNSGAEIETQSYASRGGVDLDVEDSYFKI